MSHTNIVKIKQPVRSIASKALIARRQGNKNYSIALWSLAKTHLENNAMNS